MVENQGDTFFIQINKIGAMALKDEFHDFFSV
jgi:hypothetical protein